MVVTPTGPSLICGSIAVAHVAEHPSLIVSLLLLIVPHVGGGFLRTSSVPVGGGFMNGSSHSTTLLAGGGLEAMLPSHSQPSTSKRKPMDDGNPLGGMTKKAKKDVSSPNLHVVWPMCIDSVRTGIREAWHNGQTQRFVKDVHLRVF